MATKTINSLLDVPSIATYLDRIKAEPRSIKTAVVRIAVGQYWRDMAVIRFDPGKGEVKVDGDGEEGDAAQTYGPTDDEKKAIVDDMRLYEWPEVQLANSWLSYGEPEEFREARDQRRLFEFRDLDGNIRMMQVRHRQKVPQNNEPKYVNYTLWNDGVIRKMEPDRLPLWGIDAAGDHSFVFLHEGAAAARAMSDMASGKTLQDRDRLANHPWGEELRYGLHLGWIGGAQSPHRTDWSVLKRMGIQRIINISDNDDDGRSAIKKISKQVHCPMFSLEFTDKWPKSFDLADPFPDAMFRQREDGTRHYVGPSFVDVLHPATWATDLKPVPGSRVKKFGVARQHFASQWAYVHGIDSFVNLAMPQLKKPAQQFNNMVRPFSDVADTAQLVLKAYQQGSIARLAYRPDEKPGRITVNGEAAVNIFTPSRVKPLADDPAPWLEFLAYLFPNAEERKEVARWCATLIARPEIRMEYGLLLMSEMQGTGKNTLGAKILAPLVGMHNTGFPNEKAIVESQFNTWLANRRLVFVSEIYEGQSWRAYNALKSYVTDKEVEVNEKYQRSYITENWAHFCLCSNSILALKLEADDRRWLVPTVAESPWPKEKFRALYNWLAGEGLSVIMHWAQTYGDYVSVGDKAPMTDRKRQAIDESRSDEERTVEDLCASIVEAGEALVFSSKEALSIVKAKSRGPLYMTARNLGSAMLRAKWKRYEEPTGDGTLTVRGSRHLLFMSPAAHDEIAAIGDLEAKRERLRKLEELGKDRIKDQFNPM